MGVRSAFRLRLQNRVSRCRLKSPGWLRHWQKWHPAAIGSIAMGHEIITTTVQLARAASVVANGGMLVKPRLVLKATKVVTPGR